MVFHMGEGFVFSCSWLKAKCAANLSHAFFVSVFFLWLRPGGVSCGSVPSVTVKTKSPTSEKKWKGPKLIKGGAAHLFRLTFWGEGNGPVTSGIRASPDPTPMSRQAPQ